jgi:hypothetical protein
MENIKFINQKLDQLEKGDSVWTFDIVSELQQRAGGKDSAMPKFFGGLFPNSSNMFSMFFSPPEKTSIQY